MRTSGACFKSLQERHGDRGAVHMDEHSLVEPNRVDRVIVQGVECRIGSWRGRRKRLGVHAVEALPEIEMEVTSTALQPAGNLTALAFALRAAQSGICGSQSRESCCSLVR